MQILLPSIVGNLVDNFPELNVSVYPGQIPETSQLADTTFFAPSYQPGIDTVSLLASMPKLEVIQILTAGVDRIRNHVPPGVTLCNARGVHDASTAELAIALTLASLRGLATFARAQRERRWQPQEFPSLADRRVLLVGYGSIGAAIERRLAPFEVAVTRVAKTPRFDPPVHSLDELPRLLPLAEVVILIVPLTAETTSLMDADHLRLLPDGATLVNVARGPVIDTNALVTELQSGRINAALDVVNPEPLPADHPLWTLENCLLTPHVGGASTALYPRVQALVARNIHQYSHGLPLINVITGEY
ncbi:MAG: 2-hydroxyacid dehydrogenase [Ferrimicrobium sp.]